MGSPAGPNPTPQPDHGDGLSGLHQRLEQILGGYTYKAIGELTGISTETARRYMLGQTPGAEFLATLCQKLNISAEWLLSGEGPATVDQLPEQALRDATTSQLVGAVARHVGALTDRVERLEHAVASIQRRLPPQLMPD